MTTKEGVGPNNSPLEHVASKMTLRDCEVVVIVLLTSHVALNYLKIDTSAILVL